jgi:hypothetical protein
MNISKSKLLKKRKMLKNNCFFLFSINIIFLTKNFYSKFKEFYNEFTEGI